MNQMTDSHILLHEFDYFEPATLEEAVNMLAYHGESACVLAGGTDLLVHMKMERAAPAVLVSLRRLSGLAEIDGRPDGVHIGALATVRALRNHLTIRHYYPALAEACASFSTTQVQAMATLGGNLCNGSPASDTAPALLVYGAQVVLRGRSGGERRLPLDRFLRGPGKTALEMGEIMVEVVLAPAHQSFAGEGAGDTAGAFQPLPLPGSSGERVGSTFLKISRVTADLAKASCAIALLREGDCVVACRMAFGSVAPVPMRARRAESSLLGRPFSLPLIEEAARLAAAEVAPIDDVRSSAWYRRQMVAVMARDGLERAWQRSGQPEQSQTGRAAQLRGAEPVTPPGAAITRGAGRGTQLEINLSVNGVRRRLRVAANDLLLNVLREELELTGTKYGCGIGECSACTVLLDGQPVLACLVLAVAADGREIVTVEGLQRSDGALHPLQQAFLDHAAFQCGFCTPGMLLTAQSLLAEQPHPTEAEVRDYLKGNLCRCTGYTSIVRAVLSCVEPEERGNDAG